MKIKFSKRTEQDWSKISWKEVENDSFKMKCENVKRKLSNMEKVQMEYWEMDVWKVNEFNFLNEEAFQFTRR